MVAGTVMRSPLRWDNLNISEMAVVFSGAHGNREPGLPQILAASATYSGAGGVLPPRTGSEEGGTLPRRQLLFESHHFRGSSTQVAPERYQRPRRSRQLTHKIHGPCGRNDLQSFQRHGWCCAFLLAGFKSGTASQQTTLDASRRTSNDALSLSG